MRVIYDNHTEPCATPQRDATLEGLCAPPGSLASPVTRVVDGHMLVEKFVTMQMAPVDLVQELVHELERELMNKMAGMVLTTRVTHMVVDSFDTRGWDPGALSELYVITGVKRRMDSPNVRPSLRASTTTATGVTSTTTPTPTDDDAFYLFLQKQQIVRRREKRVDP